MRRLGFIWITLSLLGCGGERSVVDDASAADTHQSSDSGAVDGVSPDAQKGDAVMPVPDGSKAADGPKVADGSVVTPDQSPPKPDGPKPPAKWITIKNPAPQVEDHTATLLQSGEVLVVGGNHYTGTDQYQDKAYRFVPSTEKFEAAGTMTTQRAQHTATLLADGRVLVTGGRNSSDYLKSTDIYSPTKPAAQAWAKGPDMFGHRWRHTATRLKSGEVLVAGGFRGSDSSATLVIFDPKLSAFKSPMAQLNVARRSHTATLLPGGKVVLTGGVQGSGSIWNTTYLDSIEIYDPKTGKLTLSKAKMSKQRAGHSATLLQSGKVLIVGGVCLNNCKSTAKQADDIYDPVTDTVTPLAHPGSLPSTHVAVRLKDNRVVVTGDISKSTYADVVLYHPTGNFWTSLPKMSVGRWDPRAVLLNDGSVLVVGGVVDSSPYTYAAAAERFYP
jgi:hypothetical protein